MKRIDGNEITEDPKDMAPKYHTHTDAPPEEKMNIKTGSNSNHREQRAMQ